jgi:hypothetical protein
MMPHVHLYFGILNAIIFTIFGVNPNYVILFVIGSVLPDIDFVYMLFSKKNHRTFFTHYPITYLIGALVTSFFTFPFFWCFYGCFLHTILDVYDFEIYPFAPFFDYSVSILNLNYEKIAINSSFLGFIRSYYKNTRIILLEVILFAFMIFFSINLLYF